MESHTAKLDQDYLNQTPTKLSKKEKKKLKKELKNKKLDADKVRIWKSPRVVVIIKRIPSLSFLQDLDTSEMKSEASEKKKKKKKFLF